MPRFYFILFCFYYYFSSACVKKNFPSNWAGPAPSRGLATSLDRSRLRLPHGDRRRRAPCPTGTRPAAAAFASPPARWSRPDRQQEA